MRVLALVAAMGAAAIAGCETQAELVSFYMTAPPLRACEKAITSPRSDIRHAAASALESRRIDCQPYLGMIAARNQADQNQLNQGLMLMQAGRPTPAQAPAQSANCRTFNRGTYLQTVCD